MGSSGRFGPNMTPMVDVVLVILIFFMAATTIAGQEWFLRTDLPESGDDQDASLRLDLPTPMLDVSLFVESGSPGGRIMVQGLGNEARTLDSLLRQIESMDDADAQGLILRVGADDRVPYGSIVALHDAGTRKNMRVAIR